MLWLAWPLWFLLWLQVLTNNHQETFWGKGFIFHRSLQLKLTVKNLLRERGKEGRFKEEVIERGRTNQTVRAYITHSNAKLFDRSGNSYSIRSHTAKAWVSHTMHSLSNIDRTQHILSNHLLKPGTFSSYNLPPVLCLLSVLCQETGPVFSMYTIDNKLPVMLWVHSSGHLSLAFFLFC